MWEEICLRAFPKEMPFLWRWVLSLKSCGNYSPKFSLTSVLCQLCPSLGVFFYFLSGEGGILGWGGGKGGGIGSFIHCLPLEGLNPGCTITRLRFWPSVLSLTRHLWESQMGGLEHQKWFCPNFALVWLLVSFSKVGLGSRSDFSQKQHFLAFAVDLQLILFK